MNARQSSRGKRISKQQEKRAAADLGGRTMAASGGTRLGGGGDVRVMGDMRIECKVTEGLNFVLKKSELEKIRQEANRSLEEPVMQFAFLGRNGKTDKYAIVLGFSGECTNPHELDTYSNSIRLNQNYLHVTLYGKNKDRLVLTFRDGVIARKWEIMTWTRFLAKRKRDED